MDLPQSWVPRLVLDPHEAREEALGPAASTTTVGYKCMLERFVVHAHPVGLTARFVEYRDTARTRPLRITEAFQRRRDGLYKRVRHLDTQTTEQHFTRGTHFAGCALIVDVLGKRQELYFYHGARVDGLVKRVHEYGKKITEWYSNVANAQAPVSAIAAGAVPGVAPPSTASGSRGGGAGGSSSALVGGSLSSGASGVGASASAAFGSGLPPVASIGVSRLWYRSITLAPPEAMKPLQTPASTTPTPTIGSKKPGASSSKAGASTPQASGALVSVDGLTTALTIEIGAPRAVEVEIEDDLMAQARAKATGALSIGEAHNGKRKKTVMQPSEQAILKMTEKYVRDYSGATPPHLDVATAVYRLDTGSLQVITHHEPGRVTYCSRLYLKATGKHEVLAVDHYAPELRPFDTDAEFRKLQAMEKECHTAARARARVCLEIEANRTMDEAEAAVEKTLFEVAVDRARSGVPLEDEAEKKVESDEVDYLLPFLLAAKCADPDNPNEKEARRADRECRLAYKNRLLERVAIIQARLEKENDDLLRRQQAFSRNRDHAEGAEEEFEKYCVETTFRIGILEQRLERQEAMVRRKFEELEARLASDPRLAIIHNPGAVKGGKGAGKAGGR